MCRFAVTIAACGAIALAATAQGADVPKEQVRLTLNSVSMGQYPATARLGFRCSITLDNATGKFLPVKTRFGFVWENMALQIHDAEGKKIREVKLTDPAKQKAVEQSMVIKPGKTTTELLFYIPEQSELPKQFKVRVVGTLPGSDYKAELVSDLVEVTRK
jgi:hypothetical protein